MPQEQMTPQQFWDACNKFDWFYEMSDDARVWRRGEVDKAELLTQAPLGSQNRLLWTEFHKHHYSGVAFGTPKHPKPDRPV